MLNVRGVEAMRELGNKLGSKLKAGDIVVLSGNLGAGKTALTQGIGQSLGIKGITSPTFVIARVHKGVTPLIHVDAYRLLTSPNAKFEFDDLDLDTGRQEAITVIEWGGEVGARFGQDFLEIEIGFGPDEDEREVTWKSHGQRWLGFEL
jgi:tRNA threonylcarbamoyladenosine biosynthesis protein TsaE